MQEKKGTAKVVGKVPEDIEKRALITLYKYLPSRSEQIAAARAWGIRELLFDGEDISAVLIEDVSKVRTTNWAPKLPLRRALMADFNTGKCNNHVVFFANPLCLGWTEALAKELSSAILSGGGGIYIHDMSRLYKQGDELDALWSEWQRQLTNATQADYRQRRRSK
ncbi:hypothetical protein [Flexibacterium corallicola]|uniref:hypothetical protein n=1 Tax=Flexibacterium corallicola TaxID=3037259 RepID=UPI00286EC843|nr:hypothetical protein [Pseudovibrio sp. M1P-2-3]